MVIEKSRKLEDLAYVTSSKSERKKSSNLSGSLRSEQGGLRDLSDAEAPAIVTSHTPHLPRRFSMNERERMRATNN